MTSRPVAESVKAERKFSKVVESLSRDRGVTIGRKKGFGFGALKAGGKIFAMLSSADQFVVKLPTHRVDALVTSGGGKHFEPRPGKLMKEWLVVESERANWIGLAKEAYDFVKRHALKHKKCPLPPCVSVNRVEVTTHQEEFQ